MYDRDEKFRFYKLELWLVQNPSNIVNKFFRMLSKRYINAYEYINNYSVSINTIPCTNLKKHKKHKKGSHQCCLRTTSHYEFYPVHVFFKCIPSWKRQMCLLC